MNTRSDSRLKSSWSTLFSRKGAGSETVRLWDDWDELSRRTAIDIIKLWDNELPVLLSIPSMKPATAVTTRRVISGSNSIEVDSVCDVKPVEFSETQKDQLSELDLLTETGDRLRISVDPGPGYFGLWSLLLHIAKGNQRKQSSH
jgi:hypothetical protein